MCTGLYRQDKYGHIACVGVLKLTNHVDETADGTFVDLASSRVWNCTVHFLSGTKFDNRNFAYSTLHRVKYI
jgi:hypothetical protein